MEPYLCLYDKELNLFELIVQNQHHKFHSAFSTPISHDQPAGTCKISQSGNPKNKFKKITNPQ